MIRTLVICDDYWHPGEVVVKGLRTIPDTDICFDFVMDAKDILTVDSLKEYQVIMNCKCNNINAANPSPWFEDDAVQVGPKELKDYVWNGGGFLSVHSGNAFYRENDCWPYIEFVGNYFVQHPPRCPVTVLPEGKHPITDGIRPFTIFDEHYEIAVVADDITPILYTESERGGRQIGGYVRTVGAGRMCILTPGHVLGVWTDPDYQRLLVQAIRWCAKRGEKL